jgi:hypothetical protein
MPSIPGEFRGVTIKMVIKDGVLSLGHIGPRWYGCNVMKRKIKI